MKGNKDFTPIYILEYLKNNTDEDHPETFTEIEEMLRYDYGLDYTRQTVAAKINNMIKNGLIEGGPRKGVFFGDRDFDDSELMLLIYSVLSNKSISPAQADKLVARLSELGGSFFDTSGLSIIGKGDAVSGEGNQELFLNLETVHDAIRNGRQLEFDYCRYGIDKKLNKYAHYVVSPYHVAMKNQKLYLLSGTEEDSTLRFFRVEHMKNAGTVMKKAVDISKMSGYEEGMDINRHIASLPYMFSDKPEEITFRADASILNQIIDWFGKEVIVKEDPDNSDKILASIRTSPKAMRYWAQQYLESVEILSPQSLRNELAGILFVYKNKYKSKDKTDGPVIRFTVKKSEKLTPPSDDTDLKKSHEFEDPGIRQLEYYFDTKPSDLITAMYRHTGTDGILNVPVHPYERPVNNLGKKILICKMDWDSTKATELTKDYYVIYDALVELSKLHAEIDVLDLEDRVSPGALKTWNVFFKDYDFEELEKELEKGMAHLIEKVKNPERFASTEEESRRIPQDERAFMFADFQILKDIRSKMKTRFYEEGRFLDDLFIRVRRLYLLMAYDAPKDLIEIEARRVARYMALSKYCVTYDWSYLSD